MEILCVIVTNYSQNYIKFFINSFIRLFRKKKILNLNFKKKKYSYFLKIEFKKNHI